jgi:hypothetical protein
MPRPFQEDSMATESSVVVALREVRRLELDRQKREEESRLRAQEEDRANQEAARRATIQYEGGMSPFANGNGHGNQWGQDQGEHRDQRDRPESFTRPMRRTTEVVPLAANGSAYSEGQSFVQTGPWDNALGGPPEKRRSGGTFRTMVLTLVLCGLGAGFGYQKLNAQFAAERSDYQAKIQKADEARHEAVAERSRAEQELKVKVAELEGKVATAQAKASAYAMAQAAARGAGTPTTGEPLKPAALGKPFLKGKAGPGAVSKAVGRPGIKVARPALPPLKAAPPKPVVPAAKMAKKKALSDDPLGGLRL